MRTTSDVQTQTIGEGSLPSTSATGGQVPAPQAPPPNPQPGPPSWPDYLTNPWILFGFGLGLVVLFGPKVWRKLKKKKKELSISTPQTKAKDLSENLNFQYILIGATYAFFSINFLYWTEQKKIEIKQSRPSGLNTLKELGLNEFGVCEANLTQSNEQTLPGSETPLQRVEKLQTEKSSLKQQIKALQNFLANVTPNVVNTIEEQMSILNDSSSKTELVMPGLYQESIITALTTSNKSLTWRAAWSCVATGQRVSIYRTFSAPLRATSGRSHPTGFSFQTNTGATGTTLSRRKTNRIPSNEQNENFSGKVKQQVETPRSKRTSGSVSNKQTVTLSVTTFNSSTASSRYLLLVVKKQIKNVSQLRQEIIEEYIYIRNRQGLETLPNNLSWFSTPKGTKALEKLSQCLNFDFSESNLKVYGELNDEFDQKFILINLSELPVGRRRSNLFLPECPSFVTNFQFLHDLFEKGQQSGLSFQALFAYNIYQNLIVLAIENYLLIPIIADVLKEKEKTINESLQLANLKLRLIKNYDPSCNIEDYLTELKPFYEDDVPGFKNFCFRLINNKKILQQEVKDQITILSRNSTISSSWISKYKDSGLKNKKVLNKLLSSINKDKMIELKNHWKGLNIEDIVDFFEESMIRSEFSDDLIESILPFIESCPEFFKKSNLVLNSTTIDNENIAQYVGLFWNLAHLVDAFGERDSVEKRSKDLSTQKASNKNAQNDEFYDQKETSDDQEEKSSDQYKKNLRNNKGFFILEYVIDLKGTALSEIFAGLSTSEAGHNRLGGVQYLYLLEKTVNAFGLCLTELGFLIDDIINIIDNGPFNREKNDLVSKIFFLLKDSWAAIQHFQNYCKGNPYAIIEEEELDRYLQINYPESLNQEKLKVSRKEEIKINIKDKKDTNISALSVIKAILKVIARNEITYPMIDKSFIMQKPKKFKLPKKETTPVFAGQETAPELFLFNYVKCSFNAIVCILPDLMKFFNSIDQQLLEKAYYRSTTVVSLLGEACESYVELKNARSVLTKQVKAITDDALLMNAEGYNLEYKYEKSDILTLIKPEKITRSD